MSDKLYKYVHSESQYAKERGYSGYVVTPLGERDWVKSDREGKDIVRDKNKELITFGAKAHAFVMGNPGVIHLIMSIVTILKTMGMTLESLYEELKAKATPHVLGECLQQYLKYVDDRFKSGIGSKPYIETVKFTIKHLPASMLALNISQLKSDEIKAEMETWTTKGG